MISTLARVFVAALSLAALTTTAYADDAARTKELWSLCSMCHGTDGAGVQLYKAPSIAGLPDWYLRRQLDNFRKGVRGGIHPGDLTGMRMRPIARMLDDHDVDLLVALVAGMPRPNVPNTMTDGSLVKGEQTFETCKACHGPGGEGNKDLNAPPIVNQADWYVATQLDHFRKKARGFDPAIDPNGATMQGIASALTDDQVKGVIAYLNVLKPAKKK